MLDMGVSNKTSDKVQIKSSLNGQKKTRTMRKFVNSAIYVEKPLPAAPSTETSSSKPGEDSPEAAIKRCTCSVNQRTCPFHSNSIFTFIPKEERGVTSISSITLRGPESKVKISQCVSNSNSSDSKKIAIQRWIAKKEEERRRREAEARLAMEVKLKEKEILLEQERRNFQQWLTNKKKAEERAKKKKEKELEEQQLKELEKEKKQLESELKFQLWLKKKEEASIEKKIRKQIEMINELERKERQTRENQKAFQEWLKNSRNRQRPAPMNKGIETLYSSSVTYVNPNPWKSAA